MRTSSIVTCVAISALTACLDGRDHSTNGVVDDSGGGVAVRTPIAHAGPDQAVSSGAIVLLSASSNVADTASVHWQWSQLAGPQVDIVQSAGNGQASFTAPIVVADQVITLQIYVESIQTGADSFATVDIKVLAPAGSHAVQAVTQQGTVEGGAYDGLRAFLGVRYAAAPVGELRFRAPAEPAIVAGITDAKVSAPHCNYRGADAAFGTEDCLFLNIWAPDDNQSHPVIFALHGGRINYINGADLAVKTGSVVVAPNRRIGVMGFLALQELIDENPQHTAGNYAILDVIAALDWVQQNIAAFGGDPQRVMLEGESAGGAIACSLFAAPRAKGLFQSAALLSPVCWAQYVLDASINEESPYPPLLELHRTLLLTDLTLVNSDCNGDPDVLRCLRDLPVEYLLSAEASISPVGTAGNMFQPLPHVDGVVVVSNPFDALVNQVAGSFPLIVGSTRDEIRSLEVLPFLVDDQDYRNFVADRFDVALVEQLYGLYPPAEYQSPTDAAYMLLSDATFGCAAQTLADAASGNRPAYLYQNIRGALPVPFAVHSVSGLFLFNRFDVVGVTPDQAGDDIISAMQSGFSGLASMPQLAPMINAGPAGNFVWPPYASDNVQVVEFGSPVAVTNQYRGNRCNTLRQVLGQ